MALPVHHKAVKETMKKRIYKSGIAIMAAISIVVPEVALAAGPVADRAGSGYDEATWARLMDNTLEYDEVPLLVHECNTNIRKIWDDLETAKQKLLDNVQELESQKRKMADLKDQATIDMGEVTLEDLAGGAADDVTNFAIQEGTLDAIAKQMRGGIKNINSKSTLASIQRGEDQITQIAQSLLISYDMLRQQKQILEKLDVLYGEQYQLAVNKRSVGMATDAEVLAAQTNQLSAQSSIASIESGLLQLKPTICTLTGWPADGSPEIADIPAVDVSQIDGIDLTADTVKAIGNNTRMMELRRSEAGKTSDGIAARLAKIEEGEQKVTIELKALYDDIFVKKAALEAAQFGYQGAQQSQAGYDRMYSLGMLSKSDYLGAQISYYQKQASCESADTALRLSIETYKWAVRGFLEIDS